MANKNEIFSGVKVKHGGLFVFKDFYKTMYGWLEKKSYDWKELEYIDKQLPSGDKKVEISWEANKKVDDYTKFTLTIDFNATFSEKEIEQNDKKKKMDDGAVEIKLGAFIITDYEDNWDKSPISKFIREIYDKYIIKGRLSKQEDDLYAEGMAFVEEIKTHLNLFKY